MAMFRKDTPRKMSRPRRKKHDIICERCGARDQVNFSPKGTAPVLCSRCHRRAIRESRKRKHNSD